MLWSGTFSTRVQYHGRRWFLNSVGFSSAYCPILLQNLKILFWNLFLGVPQDSICCYYLPQMLKELWNLPYLMHQVAKLLVPQSEFVTELLLVADPAQKGSLLSSLINRSKNTSKCSTSHFAITSIVFKTKSWATCSWHANHFMTCPSSLPQPQLLPLSLFLIWHTFWPSHILCLWPECCTSPQTISSGVRSLFKCHHHRFRKPLFHCPVGFLPSFHLSLLCIAFWFLLTSL